MRDEFLNIDLAPFVRLTRERMDHLAAARDLLVSDPDILRGTLVIRETGIPAFGSCPLLRPVSLRMASLRRIHHLMPSKSK